MTGKPLAERVRRRLVPISEATLERMAHILGDASAAAKCLAELTEAHDAGLTASVFRDGCYLVVARQAADALEGRE